MAYIVQADLAELLSETELIQLTDDDKLGVVNATNVTDIIESASAEIDGYVGVRYTLPLTSTPALVKNWALLITKYRLFSRRNRLSDTIRQGYEDTIAQLKDVARGVLTLGIDPPPSSSTASNSGAVYGPERVFSRDTMGGF